MSSRRMSSKGNPAGVSSIATPTTSSGRASLHEIDEIEMIEMINEMIETDTRKQPCGVHVLRDDLSAVLSIPYLTCRKYGRSVLLSHCCEKNTFTATGFNKASEGAEVTHIEAKDAEITTLTLITLL